MKIFEMLLLGGLSVTNTSAVSVDNIQRASTIEAVNTPTLPLDNGVHDYDFTASPKHDIIVRVIKGNTDQTIPQPFDYPTIGCAEPYSTLLIDAISAHHIRIECTNSK